MNANMGTAHVDATPSASRESDEWKEIRLIIEAHNDPKHALCDGAQSLDLDQFDHVMSDIKRRAEFEGRIMMP